MKFVCYRCVLLLGLLAGFWVLPAKAQNVTARLIDLPRPLKRNILSVNKDDDGFLWFRNSQGLWRYDGTNAQPFNIAKFKLGDNELLQLFTCFDHFLVLIDVAYGPWGFRTRFDPGWY